MGFGTLFIGYFLILNLTYYGITDVIAAAVMLMGLYKLSTVNKYFKTSAISACVFLAFSLGELGITFYELFFRKIDSDVFISCMSIARCLVVGIMTVLILKAIEDVAKEVDIPTLAEKSKRQLCATATTYGFWIILELPLTFIDEYILAVSSLVVIIAAIVIIIMNLSVIYNAYMKICMPGDEDITKEKPSRFSFVNEYRARKAERQKDEYEANLKRIKEKLEKKGKRK